MLENKQEVVFSTPTRRLKIFFWIILGMLSTFFSEVISFSNPFPFFYPWGILVTTPLYTLHILVLSYIVFNYGKSWFYTLFVLGAIFGMYEGYITKVLWDPSWGKPIISLGGVAVIETIMLVLFWHPFFAFIFPLLVGESLMTSSEQTLLGLPIKIKRLFSKRKRTYVIFILFAVFLGMYQSANSPSPFHSLLSDLSNSGFLVLLIYIWNKKTKNQCYLIKDLLPSKNEFFILTFLLFVMYLLTTFYLRAEALPGLAPQLIIWVIYLVLFLLLILALKKSKKIKFDRCFSPSICFSLKFFTILLLIFTFTSTICKVFFVNVGSITMLLTWIVGTVVGLTLLFLSIKNIKSVL